LEKLGLNLGFLLVQVINFAIIFVVLRAWVYKPLIKMLEDRRIKIAQGLEDARVAADARASAEEAASKIVDEAQGKATEILKDATARAEVIQKDLASDAQKKIEKERENALAEVEDERVRLLSEMRGDVSAIAIAAAQKLLGEALDEKRQHSLLTEFFSGVKGGKLQILDEVSNTGDYAEVTSALPLSHEEQEQVKSNLAGKIGEKAKVSFLVNPAILGGVVLRVGDQVVDGSVAGQLSNLQKSLI
jgi:F-type H+-transporting ATPase subunit b